MRCLLCLVFAMCLVAGGCASNEKNYKELDRDGTSPFQTEHDPMFHTTAPAPGSAVAGGTQAGSDRDDFQIMAPAGDIEVIRTDVPSVDGLSRAHWPKVRFAAARGMERSMAGESDGFLDGGFDARFERALAGAEPGNWSTDNLRAALLEPVWLARDVVTLPVRMASGLAGQQEAAPAGSGPRSPAGP